MGLVGLWNLLNDAGVAMERLGDVLDIEPEQKPDDVASRVVLPDLQGEMRLENVYFRYGGNETAYVLENISLDIRPGELVAIVGRSGSGKTTLAKLLVGFYPPTEGKIMVDGYDMSVIDKDYYRAQVGYVMQSNLLFSGTIADNIASGDESLDRSRIEEVAKMADAHALHRQDAAGLRAGGGRTRHGPVRRTGAAAVHRPRAVPRPAAAGVRRGDLGAGYAVGEQHHRQHARDPEGAHRGHHRAPAQHHHAGRQDPRAVRRRGRRAGPARGTGRATRHVLPAGARNS